MVRRPAALALAAALLAALSACGGGGPSLPTVLHAAPEPESAPPPAGTPVGLVRAPGVVGPEGVVVDKSGRYGVAAQRFQRGQPDKVLIFKTADLSPVALVTSPGAARHLELTTDGEHVIVPGEDTDTVAVLAIPSGAITSEVKVGRQPHDATEIGGVIVTAVELGGMVTASRDDTVLTTLGGLYQPGGIAQADGLAAVVDVRARLLDVYDPFRSCSGPASCPAPGPADLHMTGRVAIGKGPTHAVGLGDGTVAVADTAGDAVLIVRVSGTPKVLTSFPVPAGPYGMAVDLDRHRLWIASSGDDTLRMFTLGATGAQPTVGPTFLTVQQPNSLAVVPQTGQVVVAGAVETGQLQLVTP